ncbi:MAG TPA: MG2 domain-containing protein, partial [Kofleriaceae bacterium]
SNHLGPIEAEWVHITGKKLEDVPSWGDYVWVNVPKGVGTTNVVKLSPEIVDVWGQNLVGRTELSLTASPFEWDASLHADAGFYVLDPRFKTPQYDFVATSVTSVKVELYKVQPADFFAYEDFQSGRRKTPPGTRVYSHDYPVGKDFMGEGHVDLAPALVNGTGQVLAVATARPIRRVHAWDYLESHQVAWIQVSKLGITSRIDRERIRSWVDDISAARFLQPREGVTTKLLVEGRNPLPTATTDATGLAILELPSPAQKQLPNVTDRHRALVVASRGDDSVFTALDTAERTIQKRFAEWYVTDDRFIYKPGEPLYVKGWVRWTHDGINPGLEAPKQGDKLTYDVVDARGNKVASGTTQLGDQGGFDLTAQLPANTNLGRAQVVLHLGDQQYEHTFAVQEFRTPAYAVTLDDDVLFSGTKPLFLGDKIEMSAHANYYAGGGLEGAKLEWSAHLDHAAYRPPGWERFTFDPIRKRGETYWRTWDSGQSEHAMTLGAGSVANTEIAIEAMPDHEPAVLAVDAVVTDVDRQTIRASSRKILVHPADRYVGMRMASGSTTQIEVVVTDLDWNAVAGVPVTVKLMGTMYSESRHENAKLRYEQTCNVTSAAKPVTCELHVADPNFQYRAEATLHDARGRINTAMYMVPWWRTTDQKKTFGVTADREIYRVGETAKLTIKSDVLPATAVASITRNGVITQQRLALTKEATLLEVPIEQSYLENVLVEVDRTAKRQTEDVHPDPLPWHDAEDIDLKIDLDSSRLDITAKSTQPIVEPGADASFDVLVEKDHQPVANAEVALIVVDEAVLALANGHHADPLAPFYHHVDAGTEAVTSLNLVSDADASLDNKIGYERTQLTEGSSGHGEGVGGGAGGMMGGHSGAVPMVASVKARQDFRATAIFAPALHTDVHGHATAHVKMPESLTRFRIVALATAKTYWFGKGENTILTKRKINARTQAPRFATQGDQFEVPVIVQNLDTKPRTISVAMRAANLTGGGGKRVTVPGGQRAEVRLPFATVARGKAVIQTIIGSGDQADSSNVTVPVYEPATTETFATYG